MEKYTYEYLKKVKKKINTQHTSINKNKNKKTKKKRQSKTKPSFLI
jgi:hypothetical protein